MALNPAFTGSVLNALPIETMISSPLNAMVKSQVQASKAYADFLQAVCFEDGKAIQIQFDYDETQADGEGNYQGVLKKSMRIPLIAAVSHPNVCVEQGTVDFEMEVTSSYESSSSLDVEAGISAKVGWGPVSISVSGKVSHKSAQTRKQDTRAKYSFHVEIKRNEPPEAIMRVIDFLTDAATKPVALPGNDKPTDKTALPADSVLPSPSEEQDKKGKAAA